jgi:uncharacterized protein YxjI
VPAAPARSTVPASAKPVAATPATTTKLAAPGAAPRTATPAEMRSDPRWHQPHYVVRQRRFTLGRQYRILTPDDRVVAYAKQKWFRLKEAFTFFTDENQTHIAFTVKATKVLDFKANMEVRDAAGALLGTVRRKGWASIFADHWQIAAADGSLVGELHEDQGRGLARRMLSRLVPYKAEVRGPWGVSSSIQARFQFWGDTYDVRIHIRDLDARVILGLLVANDALQEERGSILSGLGGQ